MKTGSPYLWLGPLVPHGFHAFAEVVKDVAALDAATGGQEAADDAGDVAADVESLGVVDANALDTQAESADAGQYHGLTFAQFLLKQVLQFRHDTDDSAFAETAVAVDFLADVVNGHFALTDGLGEVFAV